MLRFAAWDLARRPFRTLLIGGAVFFFTLVTASALTVSTSVRDTAESRIIEQPAVVVKKRDGSPIPIEDTVRGLEKIPGVLGAWPRIHGGPRRMKDGVADDIALHVFHPSEATAMLPEIEGTLPWPVDVVTRESRETYMNSRVAHRSGLWTLLMIPSLLTLVYLLIAYLENGAGDVREIGIQKAVGWRARDIYTLSLYRASLVGLLPALFGGAIAYLAGTVADTPSVRLFLLGPEGRDLTISISTSGALTSVVFAVAIVMVPVYIAALIPALRGVMSDPSALIRGANR